MAPTQGRSRGWLIGAVFVLALLVLLAIIVQAHDHDHGHDHHDHDHEKLHDNRHEQLHEHEHHEHGHHDHDSHKHQELHSHARHHDHDHDDHDHHHHHEEDFDLHTRFGLAVACSVSISLVSLVGIVLFSDTLHGEKTKTKTSSPSIAADAGKSKSATPKKQAQEQTTPGHHHHQGSYSTLTLFMTALAISSLLGDVMLHLLPEILGSDEEHSDAHDHDHHGDHHHHHNEGAIRGGLFILAGLFVCLGIEIALRTVDRHVRKLSVKPMGWLNLIGDGIHNFMDGIAISSSFLSGTQIGLTTTISIFFHELPQELSDFSVLTSAGFSSSKALFFNLLSGLTCVFGCVLAAAPHLWSFSNDTAFDSSSYHQVMLAMTIASFIYIALVDMLPGILDACTENLKNFASIMVGLFSGVLIMHLLGKYEDSIHLVVQQFV